MAELVGPDPHQVTQKNIMDFSTLRKHEFVDRLSWSLNCTDVFEWDQFDFPFARYIIAYEDNKCVGGLRLHPTDEIIPNYGRDPLSFMLGDFIDGKLPAEIPSSKIIADVPRGGTHWEMTRFVSPGRKVTAQLLESSNTFLSEIGVESVLTISPILMPRLLSALGYDCRLLTEPLEFDGQDYVAIQTFIRHEEATLRRQA